MKSPPAGLITIATGVAIMLAALSPAGRPAFAQAAGDEACLTCHAAAGLSRRQDSRGGSVRVSADQLRSSVHARLSCTGCHAGATRIPHAAKLPPVRCASCHAPVALALAGSVHGASAAMSSACAGCHGAGHAVRSLTGVDGASCAPCHGDVVAQYRGSVHGVGQARGDREASTCRDCHGSAHAILSHTDARSGTSRASLAATCARCHADRELMTRRRITIPAAVQLYRSSVHGRSKNPAAATCNDCHESHRLKPASDPASSVYRANIPATCGRCHAREARDYAVSVHGTALTRGVMQSPVCTDCHGEHLIRGPRDPGSPVAAAEVTTTCSHCHEAIGIRETFGLPAGRLSSYRDSYHGLAARGGSPVAANCASCHGYHGILPSADPASATNPLNLPATCGRCHPGAGDRFARGAVHVVMATSDHPVLSFVRVLYLWLIGLTIGGMALHNGLDFALKSRRRLRAQWVPAAHQAASHVVEAGERWFLRMTLSERWQHVLLATSFLVLVFTGFALKFPEAWPFAWLARLEGGYAWRSVIHRGAALVMVAVSVAHVGYLFTARGRRLVLDLLPAPRDLFQAGENLLHLVGLRPAPPSFERFGYIEKAEYWALIWGTIVMTITGFALWFETESLRFVDKWVLDLATLIHYYEAWLAFLAIVVWHFYQNIANPDVYPMNWTWLTGKISEEMLRHEHPREYEQMGEPEESDPDASEPSPGVGEPESPDRG